MKKTSITLALVFSSAANLCFANSAEENIKQAVQAASKYANSIACEVSEITPQDVAALVPYENGNRHEAKYAVIWHGDIECLGGSGTSSSNIALVSVGAGDTFFVTPNSSSPAVNFEAPASRASSKIIDYGKDYLILEGFEYHPSGKDPMCCPSLSVKKVVRRDEKDNWIAQ